MLSFFITMTCVGFLFILIGICIKAFEKILNIDSEVGSFIIWISIVFGFLNGAISISFIIYEKISPLISG